MTGDQRCPKTISTVHVSTSSFLQSPIITREVFVIDDRKNAYTELQKGGSSCIVNCSCMCPFSQHMNAETINIHTWVWRSTHERHFIQYGLLRRATSKKCSKPNKNQAIAFKVSLSPNCSFNSTELLKLYKKIVWQILNDKCCKDQVTNRYLSNICQHSSGKG